MESDFGNDLLEAAGTLREGYSFVVNNAGKAIALITMLVAAVLTFSDVSLTSLSIAEITGTLAVMLLASYIVYFSLEDAGERLGERSEEYRSAMAKYKSAKSRICPDSIADLRKFCIKYASDELDYRRESFIAESGYTKEELEEYKSGKKKGVHSRLVFSRALKMRAVKLTPTVLLSGSRTSAVSELENPERRRLVTSFCNLLPSTVCMVFTVSVIFSAKGDLGVNEIISALIKLSALPLIGFRGYTSGYTYAKEKKSVWIETKARLLSAFSDENRLT
ncbi:MAG: hypothetical protein IJX92_04380 [Clostridia bacterium]|nr:hypothetical protein [Clostridia bacterium]